MDIFNNIQNMPNHAKQCVDTVLGKGQYEKQLGAKLYRLLGQVRLNTKLGRKRLRKAEKQVRLLYYNDLGHW